MPELRVTIAICTYNRVDYLRDTLLDFKNQTASAQQFEIIIINNNSTDKTEIACSDFIEQNPELNTRLYSEIRQGLSHARNRAITESNSEWILFIDDDVILPEDFVQNALNFINQAEKPCAAGGKILVSFDDGEPDWIPGELMPMFGFHDLGNDQKKYPAHNFPRGGNMLIHKTVAEKVGGFNPELGRTGENLAGSEEKAFFDQARKQGFELWYLADMMLYHRIGKRRLKKEYLKKQSVGIGYSEQIRLKGSSFKLLIKFLSEIAKFGISIILSILYLLRGKIKAAKFILIFRLWVMKGLFTR